MKTCQKDVLTEELKMKKMTIFGLLALMIVGIITSTILVSAYRGDYTVQGPNFSEERHELMKNAFDTLDYSAWKELMYENNRNSRVLTIVTEDNFETFVKAHKAGINGDLELAAELRSELGLNNGKGPQDGTGHGQGNGQKQGKGQGQRMQQHNFIDANSDGNCDNLDLNQVQQKQGRR